jgi:hypothetical protein
MAEYVTQGTVQVEINGANLKVRINPSQNYAVKHNGIDNIIFMPINVPSDEAKVFCAPKDIDSVTDVNLVQALIEAAFSGTKIEIKVDKDCNSIKSIKIPATS